MEHSKPTHPFTTLFLLPAFFFFHFLYHPVAADSPYTPIDNIALDCGSTTDSSQISPDSRLWVGDVNSKFFPSDISQNNLSVALSAQTPSSSANAAVYTTARLSRSQFTYLFPVSPGPVFIRLHFYSATYSNFDRSKSLFSVKARAGHYTLLRDFNASINADAYRYDEFYREFCVFVEGNDQKLDLVFIPTNQDSYAFVSGIEIVSMPVDLYYKFNAPGLMLVGQKSFFPIENHTSLETVYRINMGGSFISPAQDTGMFRSWSQDSFLVNLIGYNPSNPSIQLNYSKIPRYVAPDNVYQTAQTMGPNITLNKSFNLTWEFPVDPEFYYMLRLHFCEIEREMVNINLRMFVIYIRDEIAEKNADIFRWAGGRGIPYFRDYVVYVPISDNKKKVNLSVKLQPQLDEFMTRWSNVLLNGIEIFKLNDSSGNLAGQNPDYIPFPSTIPTLPQSQHTNRKVSIKIILIPVVVGVVVAIFFVGLFVVRRSKICTNMNSSHGTSWYAPFSLSTIKSSQTRSSNLPSSLCRSFSLDEIKAATKDFNDIFIVGIGGFGNVYKGYIDDGATQVAIKRLKPGSKQGAQEFKTEIEMLSQLRHLHLVSLIGYCNEGNEMIIVYDYMSHGTLRSHLYGDKQQPLNWKQRLQICIGAARGLHYLHTGAKHVIIHRDVKTTNILLDERYIAKVSDFGLSKAGELSTSKKHISTVVKGSFGYLDPEYYRRQQLTEKSDVYSFGVVLCEVLCGRPPLMRNTDKNKTCLAEWVRRCNREDKVGKIIDPNIVNDISVDCLRKFVEIALSCIEDEGSKRPVMNDVVWGLEFALQLQEASKKGENGDGDDVSGKYEGWMMEEMSSEATTTYSDSSCMYNKELSNNVFSEINDPRGR